VAAVVAIAIVVVAARWLASL